MFVIHIMMPSVLNHHRKFRQSIWGGALHNEGSELLQARLDGKVKTDFQTARRLFTLICVLHSR